MKKWMTIVAMCVAAGTVLDAEPVKVTYLGGDVLNAAQPSRFEALGGTAGQTWTAQGKLEPGRALTRFENVPPWSLFGGDVNALLLEPDLDAPFHGALGEIECAKRMIRLFLEKQPEGSVYILQSPPPLSEAARKADLSEVIEFPAEPEKYRAAFEFERIWMGLRDRDEYGKPAAWRHRSYELFDALVSAFPALKKQTRLHLVPVGDVYDKLHRKMAEGLVDGFRNIGEFYADDLRQKEGLPAYTIAATLYAVMFDADPETLDHKLYASAIDPGVADLVDRTIWHEVRWNPRANRRHGKTESSIPRRSWPSVELTPLLDIPMRDPSILRADDGFYYLTGTPASHRSQASHTSHIKPDFQNNPGIRLWRSKNLRDWEELGEVWNMAEQAMHFPEMDLAGFPQIRPDEPSTFAHGVTQPEIHKAQGTYWICFSVNDNGTALLRSKTGKPEGPYENWSQLSKEGTDPSMFEDDDGAVYWIMNDGWMARLTDDLKGFAEPPRLMAPKPDPHRYTERFKLVGDTTHYMSSPQKLCDGGAQLIKKNGMYVFFGERKSQRYYSWCMDTHVMCSTNIYGPYSDRHLMIPHGGQAAYFEDADGMPYAAFSGSDIHSVLKDRGGIIPLKWLEWDDWEVHSSALGLDYPRKPQHIFTQKGLWSKMKPVPLDEYIRDCTIFAADDGEIFISGSLCSRPRELIFWRTRDLMHWTEWHPDADIARLELEKQDTFNQVLWSCELSYFDDTYWITTHGLTSYGAVMYRSKTGKIEGPYEWKGSVGRHFAHDAAMGVAVDIFQGLDGKNYAVNQIQYQCKVAEADLSAKDWTGRGPWDYRTIKCEPWPRISIDYWGAVDTMEGKYIHIAHAVGSNVGHMGRPGYLHSYDVAVLTGDTPWGPFRNPQCIPHMAGGWTAKFAKDSHGRWWGIQFGDNYYAPWWLRMGLIPLNVEKRDGLLYIDVAEYDELTEREKAIVTGKK